MRSDSSLSASAMSAGESSKRRGRVSFGPLESFDWTAVMNASSESSGSAPTERPPRPPRRRPVTLGYGLAQQYCQQGYDPQEMHEDDLAAHGSGWEEEAQRTPRAMADETLRSEPGVRGVGEGWAGGPQMKKGSWWKRRKREEDDPLALWTENSSTARSPVKALWNRSVQAFGGSMPHLPLEGRRTKREGKASAEGTIYEQAEDAGRSSRQSIRRMFSRSTNSLVGDQALPTVEAHRRMSYSTSHLVSAPATSTGRVMPRSPVREPKSSIGSDMDLFAAPVMSRESKRMSGPRPPWRPQSYAGKNLAVAESDIEEHEVSGTSQPHRAEHTGNRDVGPVTATSDQPIDRTSTFGGMMVAAEPDQIARESAEPFGGAGSASDDVLLNSPPLEMNRQPQDDSLRDSIVGLDTIAQWSTEPKERMSLPSRRPTIFKRIQEAWGTPRSVSMRRSMTPSPMNLFSRGPTPAFGRSTPAKEMDSPRAETPAPLRSPSMAPAGDSNYPITHEAVKEALETPPKLSRSQTTRHRRRASWLGSGDGWMKRLSMLMEQDEEERAREQEREASSSASPTISPVDSKKSKRQSGFIRGPPPVRTSSLRQSSHVSTAGSTSMPMLTRLTTTDLDLRLVLPEDGLGLEDILSDSRRQSIIQSLDLDLTNDFPFPSPPTQLPFVADAEDRPAYFPRSSHLRNASEPVTSLTLDATSPSRTHTRNVSEPIDTTPSLTESRSIPASAGSAASSTFPETPHMTRADLYARSSISVDVAGELNHKSSRTSNASWTDASYHSAKEGPEVDESEVMEEISLYKAMSRLSDVSEPGEFEWRICGLALTPGAVVQAVRMPAMAMGGTKRANMVTIEELRNSPRSTRPNTPVA